MNNGRTFSGEPTISSVFSNAFSDSANFLRPIDAFDNVPKNRSSGHLSMGVGSSSVFAEPDRSYSGELCPQFNMSTMHGFEFYHQQTCSDFGAMVED